jgi:hypothetical protein
MLNNGSCIAAIAGALLLINNLSICCGCLRVAVAEREKDERSRRRLAEREQREAVKAAEREERERQKAAAIAEREAHRVAARRAARFPMDDWQARL